MRRPVAVSHTRTRWSLLQVTRKVSSRDQPTMVTCTFFWLVVVIVVVVIVERLLEELVVVEMVVDASWFAAELELNR